MGAAELQQDALFRSVSAPVSSSKWTELRIPRVCSRCHFDPCPRHWDPESGARYAAQRNACPCEI